MHSEPGLLFAVLINGGVVNTGNKPVHKSDRFLLWVTHFGLNLGSKQ